MWSKPIEIWLVFLNIRYKHILLEISDENAPRETKYINILHYLSVSNFRGHDTDTVQFLCASMRRITESFLHLIKEKVNYMWKYNSVSTYPARNSDLFNFLSPFISSLAMISAARFFGSRLPLRSVSPIRSY
jgi:hypothetical protein